MLGKKVILIVDDIQSNREMLKLIWEDDGEYELLEAESASKAMDLLKQRKDISLILLDIIMPGMSGLEMLAEIKKHAEYDRIPVILNTQSDERRFEEEALRLGADDFILKPYVGSVIKKRVENVIKKNIYERDRKDELTGIYNCETFYSQTRRMLFQDTETEFWVMRFNIAKFKLINEFYGISTGDQVLTRMARTLSRAVSFYGTYARMEADHFVCCMPADKVKPDSRFYKRMSAEISKLEEEYSMIVQCGIYIVRDRSLPISVMCDRANMASQEIKGNYLNRYAYYDEQTGERYMEEQKLIRDMQRALAEKQFYIELQPVYDTITEKPVSAEALVRWKHPKKGLISPGIFIPLFEKSGLILQLDLFVWEEVCKVLAEAKEKGRVLHPISINISRVDFYEPGLIKKFDGLMEKYGLEKRLLKLEVTESAYTENPQEIIRQVIEFRREGYDVLMDDFGSGYSSLNTLKELPVNILKIDMQFMNNLENSVRAATIVLSIVKMVRLLGMITVAEGVETKSQVEFLRNIGCNQIQGYYFSKPLAIEDYKKLMERQEKIQVIPMPVNKQGILIVDDSRVERKALMDALGKEYTYFEASNGIEALSKLKTAAYAIDLVITDIMMPGMDGFDLMKAIKEDAVYESLPIVAISSSERNDVEIKALGLGAVDLIKKPYNAVIIRQRIHNVLKLARVEGRQLEIINLGRKEAEHILYNSI